MVLSCICTFPMQDRLHGTTRRVFNPKAKVKSTDPQEYRCTVCHAVRIGPNLPKKE